MSDTITAKPRDPAAGIHPRFLHRLEDTLSCRLREFEAERHRARQLMTEVRRRVNYLEHTYGMPLAECRTACGIILEAIDELDTLKAGGGVDLDPLLEQLASFTALIDKLTAGIATGGPLADRSAFPERPATSGV